ncbi:MAG: Unknown protein [uncultured Sulfurovum sp.]|uniref:Cytochrome C n=1 Tax=uncultured Sulfurovum sp. TaxID=269237 RepID=A0A6S6SSZ4_9BACT|nr:MAG: Unknown protein [uncultured Sulfurovum sp.]
MITGCTQNINTPQTPPAIHAQKSIQLQTIMRKFDSLVFQHLQSELDRDLKRINYTQEMILIVDDLVLNSQALQVLPKQSTNKQASKGFLTLAKSLEIKSNELKKIVLNYQTEAIAPKLNEINNICTQCHDSFQ